MSGSLVKYMLFVLLLASVFSGEFILNDDNATGLSINQMAGDNGFITGNSVKGSDENMLSPGTLVLIVVFILLGVLLVTQRKAFKFILQMKEPLNITSILLRIAIGLFLIRYGYGLAPAYFTGILGIFLGLALMLGVLTKPAAYTSFFYVLAMFISNTDDWVVLPWLTIALALVFIGGGKFSFDSSRKR